MLGLRVTSEAISTSSPASLNSSPWTGFIGTPDEFFNFRIMSVSQAQHKLDTIGEVNSINSLWSSRTVRHVYETEDKVSVLLAQCYGAVIAKSGTEHVTYLINWWPAAIRGTPKIIWISGKFCLSFCQQFYVSISRLF